MIRRDRRDVGTNYNIGERDEGAGYVSYRERPWHDKVRVLDLSVRRLASTLDSMTTVGPTQGLKVICAKQWG